jgi:hypothetical protein
MSCATKQSKPLNTFTGDSAARFLNALLLSDAKSPGGNVGVMSAMGHSRPSHSAQHQVNVRYCQSGQNVAMPRMSAKCQ